MAYGDYVYVGTCYAAMGNTLSAMDSVMGHKFDEETMRAELNAIYNGTFFYGEEDGGVWEADCDYAAGCAYRDVCEIGKRIRELEERT